MDNFLAGYLDALDAHRRTLHTQIVRARESKLQTIADHQSDLAKRCADARTAIQFAEDLLTSSNDTEILTFSGILLKRFEHCQRSRDFLDPRTTDALTFLPEIQAPFTMDQKNIPMYGIITTQTAAPRLCTMATDGFMQLRVHRKVEVTMTARDAEDRPLCHGGLSLDVVLKYRNGTARTVATKVSDRRDGTYAISFVPELAGALEMSVMVHGKHVKVRIVFFFFNQVVNQFYTGKSIQFVRSYIASTFGHLPLLHILFESRLKDGGLCLWQRNGGRIQGMWPWT